MRSSSAILPVERQPATVPVTTPGSVTLVTGAAGLIGSSVLAKLRAQGRRALGVDLAPKPQQSDVERADLIDIHRLHMIARNAGVTAIIHYGAVSGPMVMIENPYGIIQANVMGTANILEFARIHRMRRVVFCSSASAYGPTVFSTRRTRSRYD
jgi:UDP-glucuronate 4-epimerase